MLKNLFKFKKGQTMILTVVIITSSILGVALVAGMLIVFQIRSSGDFANTNKAIFAADAGTEWWLYNYYNPTAKIDKGNITFTNGASFDVFEQSPNQARIVGMAGKSKRAFFVEATRASTIDCNANPDVIFAIDNSGSISGSELNRVKNDVQNLIDNFMISADPYVGVVSFNNLADTEISLNSTLNFVNFAIGSIPSSGGSTNLDDAIFTGIEELSDPNDRLDSTNPDYIVIITDGKPTAMGHVVSCEQPICTINDSENAAAIQATEARNQNIQIFVIGVGTDANSASFLVDDIATDSNHYFDVEDYDDLDEVLPSLVSCN